MRITLCYILNNEQYFRKEEWIMNMDLLNLLAPFIIGINGMLLIGVEVMSAIQEKKKNTEHEEIKKRWEECK